MNNGEVYDDGDSVGAGDRVSDHLGVSETSTTSNSMLARSPDSFRPSPGD